MPYVIDLALRFPDFIRLIWHWCKPYSLAISDCGRESDRIAKACNSEILDKCDSSPVVRLCLAYASKRLSPLVPKDRCAGFTHFGLSQECMTTFNASLILPLCSS